MDKKILDVTCGGRSIWFDKHHPAAIYCDERQGEYHLDTEKGNHKTLIVEPDVVCNFTKLPFESNSFALVVFDPPHIVNLQSNSWLIKEYGSLTDGWKQMLHDGFRECMRVLKPDGVLIFKWSEVQIPAEDVWKAIGQKPLFGHHSGKKMNTFWGCFMKLEDDANG
jgi:ubiquinone/menaquinone biosynthesis C-methylase UbiE